jgi:CubicO group peptidase (beta-lactamase class C family)
MSAIASLLVGVAVLFAACSGSDSRPVTPRSPVPESAPAVPVAAKRPEPVVEQIFAPGLPAPGFADPERRAKLAAAFPALDKALEKERVADDVPGVVVGVVIDGELAYAKGFGVVDPATQALPDADTVYRIGSITKSFTGLALLSLRDDGLLGLDDPLARWIPEAGKLVYPTRDARPITLRQLAQHTSGLQRDGAIDLENDPDEATVVGSLAKVTLDRAPGLESVYSNLGFGLLGITVSHAAKQPLHDVIASRIWKPLGMTSTRWDPPSDKLAPAFGADGKPRSPLRLGALDGDGGIFSTVRDMARYTSFLLAAYPPRDEDDRGPIRRATIREAQHSDFALEPHVSAKADAKRGEPSVDLDASSYGFGWAREQSCTATDRISHNGAVDSYRATLVLRTSSGIGVVVMTNFATTDTLAFANRALDVLAATGAMKPRERSLADPSTYTPLMTAFLDVYNNFDHDKLASILARPMDPREPDELAGYKALHGRCTAFKLTRVTREGKRNALEFAMTCEHGPFELELNVDGDKLGGFTGRSPGIAAPDKIKKLIAAALAVYSDPVWSASNYKLVFPKQPVPEPMARRIATRLRSEFGTCKQRSVVSDGTGWMVELDCSKGRGLTLSIHFDHDVIDDIVFRAPQGIKTRCPTR